MRDLEQLCRLCTSDKNITTTIFSTDSNNVLFLNKLQTIAPGMLDSNSKLPNGICSSCISQLNDAYKFVKTCTISQGILNQYLTELETETNLINENNDSKFSLNGKQDANFESVYIKQENEDCDFKIDIEESFISQDFMTNSEDIQENSNVQSINKEKGVTLEKRYICEICKTCFENVKKWELHLSEIHAKLNCKVCRKIFSDPPSLKRHVNTVHRNERRYKCNLCDRAFNYHYSLTVHKVTHTNDKLFKCKICDKTCATSSNLKTHMCSHTKERVHTCYLCEKSFINSSHLKRHMLTHTQEKPYQCKLCDKAFNQNANLKTHVWRYHTNAEMIKNEAESSSKFVNLT